MYVLRHVVALLAAPVWFFLGSWFAGVVLAGWMFFWIDFEARPRSWLVLPIFVAVSMSTAAFGCVAALFGALSLVPQGGRRRAIAGSVAIMLVALGVFDVLYGIGRLAGVVDGAADVVGVMASGAGLVLTTLALAAQGYVLEPDAR